ncbi:MAG: UvrD-helicase domain-containing protein [Acidobacteriota bacterium]|nr:UvrD-helicase domain-containing protein [Acidobacteriota bacterium]
MLRLEKQLNPEQLRAVETIEGPLLILAGAGSGKTRVITYRIAHLIENKKVRADQILAVTFTNKAAEQMRVRVQGLLRRGRGANPHISTFHSFCVRVLRPNIAPLGYGSDFSIYDQADQLTLIKDCLKEVQLSDQALSPRWALSRISESKNRGRSAQEVYSQAYDAKGERLSLVFDLYQKKLREANALDFDDLLLKTVELLRGQEAVRLDLNERFAYLMVDEYQDTNRPQYELIRLLTQSRQNICVVGDEDQSIYSWRGADIQNILSFETDYPATRVIKLEQNYRSTKTILAAASALVAHNRARKGKNLWTDQVAGDLIGYYEAEDPEAEALFVVQQILAHQRSERHEPMAVLYRTNFQSRYFEEACRRFGVKYSMVGGFSFYERAEIKDLLAYLNLILNPHDRVSLLRVINTPPRGIGKVTVGALEKESRDSNLSLWEVVEQAVEKKTLPARALRALVPFCTQVQQFRKELDTRPLPDLIEIILDRSGYLQWLRSEDTEEARSRLENLQELVIAARDSRKRGETLREFLDHAALVSDTDDFDEQARVTLMTIHSAKGLEFPLVCLAGLEEDLFPHSRSLTNRDGLEEERRLCYVALTRARRKLLLTRAKNRRFLGAESFNPTEPSCFISEIPADLLQKAWGAPRTVRKSYDGPTYDDAESIRKFYRQRGKRIDLAPRKTEIEAGRFKQGQAVRHRKYGIGKVIRCQGEGDDCKLSVLFPRHGLKKLLVKYAGLERV